MEVLQQERALLGECTRRGLLQRALGMGAGALIASALPVAAAFGPASASADPLVTGPLLQAFADTIVPGRRAARTESGAAIHPLAIAGVDPLPGAVEADALALYQNPEIGFNSLAPAFIADLQARSLANGGDFLDLRFAARVAVGRSGLDFSNPTRLVWEAAAAVPFVAFCAAALVVNATAADAIGYRTMGMPGAAPHGYADFSYGSRLARERTENGSLP